MPRILSRNYRQLSRWLNTFIANLEPHLAEFGMAEGDLDHLATLRDQFAAAVIDHDAMERELRAAYGLQSTLRKAVMTDASPIIERINHHPAMTDALRPLLGLKRKNAPLESRTPISELVPSLYLQSMAGAVIVHWGPNPQDEHQNGKPAGVRGANIYRKKAGEEDFRMIAFETTSPYIDEIRGEAAEYMYVACYRGTTSKDLSAQSFEQTVAAKGVLAA